MFKSSLLDTIHPICSGTAFASIAKDLGFSEVTIAMLI
jgi:hypothetical protein